MFDLLPYPTHTHCTQNCPTDVFVDHVWVPSLKMGMVEYVQECLKLLDPTLSLWEVYLTAACRHFTQRSLYSVLYHTQLFMKVWQLYRRSGNFRC